MPAVFISWYRSQASAGFKAGPNLGDRGCLALCVPCLFCCFLQPPTRCCFFPQLNLNPCQPFCVSRQTLPCPPGHSLPPAGAWNRRSALLFIDQPVGAGFSEAGEGGCRWVSWQCPSWLAGCRCQACLGLHLLGVPTSAGAGYWDWLGKGKGCGSGRVPLTYLHDVPALTLQPLSSACMYPPSALCPRQ